MARRVLVELLGDATSLSRAFRKSAEDAGVWEKTVGRAGEKSRDVFTEFAKGALIGVGIGGIVETLKTFLEASENLERQMIRTEAVFKESAHTVVDWSKTTANSLGMSQRASLQAADSFGQLLQTLGGFSPEKAATMSETLVKVAADLASFTGKDPNTALRALQSGLAGMTRPLRQFGIFITKGTIQQEALALGFGKSMQAALRAKTAYKDAAEAAKTANQQQATAQKTLTKAQSEFSSSQRAVQSTSDAVTAAQDQLRAAVEGVTTAENRQQTASENLTTAKRNLIAAQKTAKDAQTALTQARKDATQQLQDLRNANIDATLSEARSQLSLDQARQHLTDTMASSTATDLDKRDAVLGVQEAEQALYEAQQRRKDAAQQDADASRKGVEGSQQVVAAKKQVAAAHKAELDAQTRLAQAYRTFGQAQQGVYDAMQRAARAQTDLAKAQANAAAANQRYVTAQANLAAAQENSRRANERAKTAEDQLNKAKERSDQLNKGLKNGLTDAQRTAALYALELKGAKPAQDDFAKHNDRLDNSVKKAKANMENLQAVVGAKLAPAFTTLVNAVSKWLGSAKNQKKVADDVTAVMGALKSAVDFLRGAMHLLDKVTGSTKNSVLFLIGAYGTFKFTKLIRSFQGLSGAMTGPGSVTRATKTATTATEELSGSLAGGVGGVAAKASLVAAAGLAAYELTTIAINALGLRKPLQDLGGDVYDLAGKLGLINDPMAQFKNTKIASQTTFGQLRQAASNYEAHGLTPRQTANILSNRFPGLDAHTYDVAAGVGVGGVHYHITNLNVTANDPRQLEAQLTKRTKQRPHVR